MSKPSIPSAADLAAALRDLADRLEEPENPLWADDNATAWFVMCLDEDNIYTFATHRVFASRAEASDYAASVATSREPRVIYATKGFYTTAQRDRTKIHNVWYVEP